MKIEAEIRLRHGVMRQRRAELGLTQREVADRAGVSLHIVSGFERLNPHRTVRYDELESIAIVLGVETDELVVDWPKGVPTTKIVVRDIHPDKLEMYARDLRSRALEMSTPVNKVIEDEKKEAIRKIMGLLNSREQLIIKHRYGLEGMEFLSLEELAKKLGVTRERVRQIEAKAERRLQHPTLAKQLAKAADFETWYDE